MRIGFLPPLKSARRAWLTNFLAKLQDPATGYAAKYNVPTATITALAEGRRWVEWTFENLGALRASSQALTRFQDLAMNGRGGSTGSLTVPKLPAFTTLPGGNDTPIAPMFDVMGRAAAVGRQIKAAVNYSRADGEDLGLEAAASRPLPPVDAVAPDLSKMRLTSAGNVEVVWKKGPFQGVRIEVMRLNSLGAGAEEWSFLAVSTKPNYVDVARPAPGTTAIFRYRAIYLLNDAPYGQWSQTMEMTVRG